MRYYSEIGPRLEKNLGVLKDLVRFGRWKYTWNHLKYLIYELVAKRTQSGPNKTFRRPVTMYRRRSSRRPYLHHRRSFARC